MGKPRKAFDLERFFRALADHTRLRLLNLMRTNEVCVCFFTEILGTHQPKISRHLAYLRRAGIVSARREGQWMHYRIVEPVDENAANMLKSVLASLARDPNMQADRDRLNKLCCAPRLPVSIHRAPRPRKLSAPARIS